MLVEGKLLARHALTLAEDGMVVEIAPWSGEEDEVTYLSGLICPAFVNAHCHLELSHLAGMIPRHTGMAGFVMKLQGIRRNFEDEEKQAAIAKAAEAMYARGIVAVGDICNGESTLAVKQARSDMHFHNFVEVFGANPGKAEEIVLKGLDLVKKMGPHSSLTLHAPYSISVRLRDMVLDYAKVRGWVQSMHFLESTEERQLFEALDGPLMDMLRTFGLVFQPHTYSSPSEFLLETLSTDVPTLFVHNTEITTAEFQHIVDHFPKAYFVLCPKANQYIHNTLPSAPDFAAAPDRICIGTDSLAGNDRLDLYAEIQTLQAQFHTPTEILLRWASENGAGALGLDPSHFSIAKGHQTRLLHIDGILPESAILPENVRITHLQPGRA
ncbi:MAG: amidohydrolase family protein [Bacteroidota bacterium]